MLLVSARGMIQVMSGVTDPRVQQLQVRANFKRKLTKQICENLRIPKKTEEEHKKTQTHISTQTFRHRRLKTQTDPLVQQLQVRPTLKEN